MSKGHGGWRPNSGRKKTKQDPWALTDKERIDLLAYCKSIGYDPVVRMAEMGEDPATPNQVRLACHREVARYVHPQLGRVDVIHDGKIEGGLAAKSLAELRKELDDIRSKVG